MTTIHKLLEGGQLSREVLEFFKSEGIRERMIIEDRLLRQDGFSPCFVLDKEKETLSFVIVLRIDETDWEVAIDISKSWPKAGSLDNSVSIIKPELRMDCPHRNANGSLSLTESFTVRSSLLKVLLLTAQWIMSYDKWDKEGRWEIDEKFWDVCLNNKIICLEREGVS